MPENTATQLAPTPVKGPVFTFQRMGGVDQAILRTDEEWRNLDKLDRKLWMALSCPTAGLEYSPETLAILDSDGDGRIRAEEVKDAVAWCCRRLVHPANMANCKSTIDLQDLRDDTEEGRTIINALEQVLAKKEDGKQAGLADIENVLAEAAGYSFNGDGILPADSVPEELREFVLQGLAICGGKRDASGKPGLDAALAREFVARLEQTRAWRTSVKNVNLPLGENTAEAWTLLQRLAPKIDDFFCRCRLAAYVPEAAAKMNAETLDQSLLNSAGSPGSGLINTEKLLELPLAEINAQGQLNLISGLNPAWENDTHAFFSLAAPLLDNEEIKILDEQKWLKLKNAFAGYAGALDKRPTYPLPPEASEKVNIPGLPALVLACADDPLQRAFLPADPSTALEKLSDDAIAALLAEKTQSAFAELVQKDLAAPPLAAFQELRKLALLQEHLYVFLMNFLSFLYFYDPQKKAIFQTGSLYLDSRQCLLCVPVSDVETHARLAAQSHLCLIYCACNRKNSAGAEQTCTIAAALTMGSLASLIEGRHGLFVDNEGNQWDSRIIKIVHNPISLREAMWAPYIRASNMAAEQINKFVAAKAKAANETAAGLAGKVSAAAQAAPGQKQSFDFAKGAGIFAALSVAVSMLSAAFAYIANSLASLGWLWPFAIVAAFIFISGPSMLIAWFKLRKRNLGPLLDASGWAVNKGAPINLVMGQALTTLSKLPPNAQRDLNDPYSLPAMMRAKKRRTWFRIIISLLVLLICLLVGFAIYCKMAGEPVWFFYLRAILNI